MKTKKTKFVQNVAVWAIPAPWQDATEPFFFQVRTDEPYHTGAVKVYEQEVTLVVPEGIDLTHAAIATLEAAKDRLAAEYQKDLNALDEQIKKLTYLEHIDD